ISAYSDDAVSYYWETDGLTDSSVEYISAQNGMVYYKYTAQNAYGCQTIDSVGVDFVDCSSDYESLDILIYPNPNDGHFTISIDGIIDDMEIAIIDFIGRIVIEDQNVKADSHVFTGDFDLSPYEDGVYFVRIIHDGKVYNERIVVQK
ncbi:MAG: T9SS type A sorting domain-containing protein, partial [Bacteroidales bacterium]|nr:T9SS type A sorting domain-containing protein [Bacteroidales bacterium]